MRTQDLRRKYPEMFARVEAGMWDDMLHAGLEGVVSAKVRRRLAYNAAALAVFEHYRELKLKVSSVSSPSFKVKVGRL